jgi:hypothetical protein
VLDTHYLKAGSSAILCKFNRVRCLQILELLPNSWIYEKEAEAMPWDRLCVDLIGPYNIKSNVKGVKIPPLKCITMFNPATGWFEIKQYDDKKSITVTNIVEQEWLTHYP